MGGKGTRKGESNQHRLRIDHGKRSTQATFFSFRGYLEWQLSFLRPLGRTAVPRMAFGATVEGGRGEPMVRFAWRLRRRQSRDGHTSTVGSAVRVGRDRKLLGNHLLFSLSISPVQCQWCLAVCLCLSLSVFLHLSISNPFFYICQFQIGFTTFVNVKSVCIGQSQIQSSTYVSDKFVSVGQCQIQFEKLFTRHLSNVCLRPANPFYSVCQIHLPASQILVCAGQSHLSVSVRSVRLSQSIPSMPFVCVNAVCVSQCRLCVSMPFMSVNSVFECVISVCVSYLFVSPSIPFISL